MTIDQAFLDKLITDQDRAKAMAMLSLLNANDQPNMNSLNEIARNINILSLNVKAFGYDLAQKMAAALPPRGETVAQRQYLPSKLSTQADMESDWVAHWCRQFHAAVIYHRKLWELAYVAQALFDHDMIAPGRRGLGFGCGREPVASYLAAHGAIVTVTDLPAGDAEGRGWAETGQHVASLDQAYDPSYLDRATFNERVGFRAVDMTAIPDDLLGYDFCWSICALEHLGSIEKGLSFVERSLDTLRPGGISVHTTEFNIDNSGRTVDNWPTVLFQQRHFHELEQRLAAAGHRLAPLDFDPGTGILDRFVDLPPWQHDMPPEIADWVGPAMHLKVGVDGFVATCIGFAVQKAA